MGLCLVFLYQDDQSIQKRLEKGETDSKLKIKDKIGKDLVYIKLPGVSSM